MESTLKNTRISMDKLIKQLENPRSILNVLNRKIVLSADEWHDLFSYSSTRDTLENFMLYKIANKLNIYEAGRDDADCTPEALEYLAKKLKEKTDNIHTVTYGKKIGEKARVLDITLKNGRSFMLESDTAISLMTDLSDFFRQSVTIMRGKKWVADYCAFFGVDKPNEIFRNFYWLLMFTKDERLLQALAKYNLQVSYIQMDEMLFCLKSFEERAKWTYSYNNLILVPYGYNTYRYAKFADKIDDTINEICEVAVSKRKVIGDAKCKQEAFEFLAKYKDRLYGEVQVHYPPEYRAKGKTFAEMKLLNDTIVSVLSCTEKNIKR